MKTKKSDVIKLNKNKVSGLKRNILFLIIIVFSVISLVFASTFIDNSSTNFNLGTYNWTFYNASGFIQLNSSRLNGTYTSQIFNAGSPAHFNNISWTSNAIGELPNNQQVETSFGSGNANMTGNVLLMHFNNDSAYGENSTRVYDFSGNGNNGTISGATFNTSGKLNGAYSFDGVDDYVNVSDSNSLNITNQITLSAWINPQVISAIGGNIVTDWYDSSSGVTYRIHTFISNGTFNVTGNGNVEVLIVAGGGGGGAGSWGGGGGAGGIIYNTSVSITGNISVIVGVGGTGSNSGSVKGTNGSDSIFIQTAKGGGGGGSENTIAGNAGGSGGGGGYTGVGGSGTIGQGFGGGTGGTGSPGYGGGGGGGANESGQNGSIRAANYAGNGGNGTLYTINGSAIYYGGGGGGGAQGDTNVNSRGFGGLGGGGDGGIWSTSVIATNGTTNTGGGGGGGKFSSLGGSGGSGIIIVRYPIATIVGKTQTAYQLSILGENFIGYINNQSVNATATANQWQYVVLTYNGSTEVVYVNGLQKSSVTLTGSIGTNTQILTIGNFFNGTIDEVAIWNRSLSAQEVLDIYKRGALKLNLSVQSCDDSVCSGESWTNLGSNLTSPQNLSLANNTYFQYKFDFATDNISYTPELYNISINYDVLNQAPNNPSLSINSTDGRNSTFADLNCFATLSDNNNDTMNVSTNWYKNNILNLSFDYNNSYANSSFLITVLKKENLTVGDVWKCGIRLYDGTAYSDWVNSSNLTILDITPPSITLNSPSNNTNTSSTNINFNFTGIDETATTLNCSIFLDNNRNQTNGSVLNGTLTNFNITGISERNHTWFINCTDGSNNQNKSEVRSFYLDLTPPNITNIIYSPNSSADLDPSTNIIFNATVSDNWIGVSSVILQYHNGTTWANKTMTNNSATNYNTTITLVSTQQNYTFNIWTNDSLGNSNRSVNQTFSSTWDCTWTSTSDLSSTAGWDINKWIGNITINNTGDSAYSVSNCSLDFRLTYDLSEGRIYYDNEYVKNLNSYTVSAKSNQTIQINATFGTEVKQENVIITLDEFRGRSQTGRYRNTTATIVSNQNGPYLYQVMTSYPTSVYLTIANFSLQGYLRNIMGSSTVNENNTAYNVTFYWTLPSGLTNVSGNLTANYTNITDNNLNYNNIYAGFSNLASMTSGAKTAYLYSFGYNLTGSLIVDANNNTLLTNSVNISFLCYNVSDGICVTSCGYIQDSDCSAPSTATTPASSTSSGGGGGSAANAEAIATSADFQLVRGEQNEVKIIFENKDNNESLKDLSFSVSGKIAKYIDISPKQVSYLGPKSSITVTLLILSPTYIELGKQELTVTMKGKKGSSDYTDSKKITLEIHELSMENAYELLNKSKELINQLNEANLSSDSLNELLVQAEEAIKTFNFEIIKDNYQKIQEQVKYALDSKEIITELESLIKSAEEKGIDVSESTRLLKLAKLSIERREFEQAYKRVKDSQLTYALEVKGEFGKLSYYLEEYPKEISLGAFFLVVFSFGAYNINKLRTIKNRIRELKEEEKILNELIRVVQNECFKEKKMNMDEYETVIKEYNKKLSNVIEELIELETKRAQILIFSSKTKRLKIEREKIISLIKELQGDYMKKKKFETRTFEIKMESFNKRISEIEEKLATLEARKAVKGFGISLKILKGE